MPEDIAGATPAPAGATPAITDPTAQPATGDDAPLGEPGKRALDAERALRAAAEKDAKALRKELDALTAASKTESERAIDDARKAGAAETLARVHGQVRRSEVRAALVTAGVNPTLLDLAVKADPFAELVVDDDGDVSGLAAAVEAFRREKPDLFAKPAAAPSFDTGRGAGRGASPAVYTRDQLRDPKFYAANKADILKAATEGRISN